MSQAPAINAEADFVGTVEPEGADRLDTAKLPKLFEVRGEAYMTRADLVWNNQRLAEENAEFSDGRELSLRMGHRTTLSVPLLKEGESIGAIDMRRWPGLPPLTATLARRMMERTKIYAALKGVRGRAPVDLAALEQLLVCFSRLVVEQLEPGWRELDAAQVQEAHQLGIQVLAWTVNDRQAMGQMLDLGVDGLVTDRPDIAIELLKERGIRW